MPPGLQKLSPDAPIATGIAHGRLVLVQDRQVQLVGPPAVVGRGPARGGGAVVEGALGGSGGGLVGHGGLLGERGRGNVQAQMIRGMPDVSAAVVVVPYLELAELEEQVVEEREEVIVLIHLQLFQLQQQVEQPPLEVVEVVEVVQHQELEVETVVPVSSSSLILHKTYLTTT